MEQPPWAIPAVLQGRKIGMNSKFDPDKVIYTPPEVSLYGKKQVGWIKENQHRALNFFIPGIDEYFANYGVSHENMKFAKPSAIVMHPGPMNRGIEIEGALADGPRSVITRQVTNGVAVRMAILDRIGKIMSAR